ncbi:MAG: TonB-dependent receptor [Breznakibacter sp.]
MNTILSHIIFGKPSVAVNRVFRVVCLCVLGYVAQGLAAQRISGRVVDAQSGEPILFLVVRDESSSKTEVTDVNGTFVLQAGVAKRVDLVFSHLSYERMRLSFAKPIRDTVLTVVLQSLSRELQAVQVTASPIRQLLTESYSQTNIDLWVMEEKIATALIDVLEEVPGITKRSEYHSPIALRGLGGKRLLVTKNGNRRMGNFSSGFMGQGVNVYDLSKVEVVKGPASVKYGPGAITGIINMVGKPPFAEPGLHGKASVQYGTNNRERAVMAGIGHTGFDHAFALSGRLRDADDYTAGKNVKMPNSYYRDKDLNASYSWEGYTGWMVTAESEMHWGGPWGRPLGFNGTTQMQVYNTDDHMWHTSATAVYRPVAMLKKFEASLFYDREKRNQYKDSYDVGSGLLSYRERVAYRNRYGGWRTMVVVSPRNGTDLSIGSDGVLFRIDSPTFYTDYFLSSSIRNRVAQDAGIELAGLFAELDKATPGNLWRFRGGLRADYSHIREGNVHDTLLAHGRNSHIWAWNGTMGAVRQICHNVFASWQVARSCRMPDASEMFVASSNADGLVYGNPDLGPERGLHIDAGLRGNIGVVYFDLSLFANFLHDFISLEYWTNSGKKGINYTYSNIDRARIYGGEFSVGARMDDVWLPYHTLMYNGFYVVTVGDKLTGSHGWFGQGVPLRTIPPFNTSQSITSRWAVTSALAFYAGGDVRLYAQQTRIAPSGDGGYASPSYCLFGASAGTVYRRRGTSVDVKVKADNLADNRYRPFESLSHAMGRNFKVMLTVMF